MRFEPPGKNGATATAIIIAALVLLHAVSLARVPAPFVDEAWFADRAWALLRCGIPLGTLDYGVLNWYPNAPRFYPLLPAMLHSAALAIAGGPSLLAIRTVSLGAGAILALAVWTIARSLFDRGIGLLSVTLLAVSHSFVHSAHLGRYDILAAAVGYGGISLYVAGPQRTVPRLMAGFCTGLATAFHPFSLVIVVGLIVLWAWDAGRRLLALSYAPSVPAGLLLGLAIYPILHVLPDPSSYAALTAIVYGPTHVPVAAQTLSGFAGALQAVIAAFGIATPVLIASLAALLLSGADSDRRSLVLGIAVFGAFAVIVRNKLPYYSILFTPALILCLASGTVRAVGPAIRRVATQGIPVGLALAMLTQSFLVVASPLGNDVRGDFQRVDRHLASVIRPSESIIGPQTYWFGLSHNTYYSWEQIIYLQRQRPGLSAVDALAVMRPDILIRDRHLEMFLLDHPGPELYTQLLWLPKTELETWLEVHSSTAADFDGGIYGRLRVYRLAWPSSSPVLKTPVWRGCPTVATNGVAGAHEAHQRSGYVAPSSMSRDAVGTCSDNGEGVS